MSSTRAAGSFAVVAALGAILLTGCGAGPSACARPATAPLNISAGDRRDPVVASDGGARIVAAWEDLTGGPIEASVRTTTGSWSPASAVSTDGARLPTVAVSPTGTAVIAWQLPVSRTTTRAQVATAPADGGWSQPADVSTAGQQAREPQVGITGAGDTVLLWRRDVTGSDTVIEVSERPEGGGWSTPRALSDPALRATRPRLAVAPNGAAAAVWEQRNGARVRIMAATRTPDGAWSAPAALSTPTAIAREPDVAIGPTGDAAAIWIEATGGGVDVRAASRPEGGAWTPSIRIGDGTAVPHETPRPGRAETGADVAVLPDGRVAAAWTLVQDGTNRAQSAQTLPDGTWTAPAALSRPGHDASGAQVVALAGGTAAVGWEELDGGLLRARVARLGAGGAPTGCTDLSAARAETGGVRLARGSAPTAVFVDFNRSRIQVAPIR